METNSPVLCSQQPAKGLSQMETAVFKFPPNFIPQKSAFCIFTLIGTSDLTVKLLVICFTLQGILLTVRNFSKWVSRSPGVLRKYARIPAKRRAYSLHAPPHPPFFFFSLPDYQIENSSWVLRNTSVWKRDPQTKMFKRPALEEEVSLPVCLICRSDIV
jgi:hypothetical protein